MTKTPEPGPGDQRPKETAVAYEAFRTYLEMGPSRSLAKVGEALGKSKTLMDRWSARWEWAERVRAYDGDAIAVVDRSLLEEIAGRSKRQAEIAQLHQEALALPSREILRRLKDNSALLTNMPIRELVSIAASAARAHARVVATERLALGMSTDNPSTPDSPRTAAEERAKRLTDDELEAELLGVDELAEQRKKRQRKGASG